MAAEKRSSKVLKKLESGLLGTGALLLAVFFLVKGWSASESGAGIDAFEEARAASMALAVIAEPGETGITAGQAPSYGGQPDYSLWSEKRIKEYEQSMQVNSDAPQAVLTIDHLNIRVPVYNGANEFNLNRGVARIKGTGRVGEQGNLGIAGHRDGFFRPLKEMKVGESFELETYKGTEVYTVASIDIIDPSELEVLAPTDTPTVTLVTCYPFYYVGNAPQRFIVKGEVSSRQDNS